MAAAFSKEQLDESWYEALAITPQQAQFRREMDAFESRLEEGRTL